MSYLYKVLAPAVYTLTLYCTAMTCRQRHETGNIIWLFYKLRRLILDESDIRPPIVDLMGLKIKSARCQIDPIDARISTIGLAIR
jgi:hypothetical protein